MKKVLKQRSTLVVFGKTLLMSVILLGLVACSQASSSFNEASITQTAEYIIWFVTASAPPKTSIPTPTPEPTVTLTPTFTPTVTTEPFDLKTFSPRLMSGIQAYSYVKDQCVYLSNRWGEDKASPNTIVVPVMYHTIRNSGKPLQDNMSVTEEYFHYTMDYAKKLGFETITTDELAGFLYDNEKIPERSMILIIDDRRPGVVRDHFLPVLEENDWTVTLAYIAGPAADWEWDELQRMYPTGRLDLQVHGFMHSPETYFTEYTSPEVIQAEVNNAIPIFQEKFGERPKAFIWPGGNFSPESIDAVHEAGYKVGFTAYSRGVLMYNSIPLGEIEAKMNDPLMVLPRFWSTSATVNMEEAVKMQELLISFNEINRSEEYRWYQAFCPGYPPLADQNLEEVNNDG